MQVNFVFVTGVSIYGRLEDRITIQQNELSEDKARSSVDHLSEVHVGEHHSIGLITFSKVVSIPVPFGLYVNREHCLPFTLIT